MYVCMYVCRYVSMYVCMYVGRYVFFILLHAPLLVVILHALLWYLQTQCLEISTLIISYYEISLIYLV